MIGERPEMWSNCDSSSSNCCAKYASEPANHAACMLNPDTWCDLAGDNRCQTIKNYSQQLVDTGNYSGREVLTRTINFANNTYHYATARELSDDISCAITGSRGPNTIFDASNFGHVAGYPVAPRGLGKGGWNADYDDNTDNQAFHVWSYVNTVAQGGEDSVLVSAGANAFHECWDITDVGRSTQDYDLAWAGIYLGYLINVSYYSPNEIASWVDTWLGGNKSFQDLRNSNEAQIVNEGLSTTTSGVKPGLCPFIDTHWKI
jgi:hypothetical protein